MTTIGNNNIVIDIKDGGNVVSKFSFICLEPGLAYWCVVFFHKQLKTFQIRFFHLCIDLKCVS